MKKLALLFVGLGALSCTNAKLVDYNTTRLNHIEDYLKEKAELPDWWKGELARRDVLFMPNHIDKSVIIDFINASEFYNEIVYVGKKAIFWGKYDEAEYLKSIYHKELIKQDFYKHITIRNGKTFEKIAEILEKKK